MNLRFQFLEKMTVIPIDLNNLPHPLQYLLPIILRISAPGKIDTLHYDPTAFIDAIGGKTALILIQICQGMLLCIFHQPGCPSLIQNRLLGSQNYRAGQVLQGNKAGG
ncbi:hypothetical protein SDC9_208836 [bioreactor metagenome]|uniref:Uncharacterized protein n=1 Tax=bioreactor metagenome TaxID=1076179 RepID=A0A645JD56_9ZZZZ